jgi:hypothetical protein
MNTIPYEISTYSKYLWMVVGLVSIEILNSWWVHYVNLEEKWTSLYLRYETTSNLSYLCKRGDWKKSCSCLNVKFGCLSCSCTSISNILFIITFYLDISIFGLTFLRWSMSYHLVYLTSCLLWCREILECSSFLNREL